MSSAQRSVVYANVEAGIQIGGYRLIDQIGAGGMGAVWLAKHAMLGRDAALKLLHPSYSARPEIVTRFFNEARAASTIADPGIVQIFDFGYHTDGSAYIVMELLDGEPLDRRLRQLGRLAPADALRILRQVATSLGAAHARGIVHRDLKPENIFLTRDAEVAGGERTKLLDFGIAKLSNDTDTGVKTQTAAMMGTPTYMSPEQCRGAGTVDQRSDVYALGCVLYTLVVGEPPFVADGVGEIIAMHLREPAPRAIVKAPWVPTALDDVIARCLEKEPSARFTSGGELATVFGALLSRISVVEAGSTTPPLPLQPSMTTLSSAAVASSPSRRRTTRALGVGTALAACIATYMLITRSSNSDQPVIDAPPPAVAVATVPPDVAKVEPAPVPQPEPTPRERTEALLVDSASVFVKWAKDHAGAACPTAAKLGLAKDAWDHSLVVTCKQAHQRIGIVSHGPDGKPNTADDIATWMLDPARTALEGTPWAAPATVNHSTSSGPTTQAVDADGIPIDR